MCGICGKLNFDHEKPVAPRLLRQMMSLMHHRGPDGSGEFLSGPVGLGHRRLSIIDLNTGNQPMSNEDNSLWVVFNGEIYNFLELRNELLGRGHSFKSTSDTEVILHLYEDFGESSVNLLQGMFAFALWDDRNQLLLLARDRVGIKPLYYTNTGKSFLFASEIKALLVDPSLSRSINPRAIDRFLTYYYLPGKETLLEGIYKVEPGHYITVRSGRVDYRQYWDLQFRKSSPPKNFDEAVEALRDLMHRTVKNHMISDVPVGVLLSGGVDSTGVLGYAVQQTDKPVSTFTVGFEGAEFEDERPYAKLAARHFGTLHNEITISADEFQDFLPRYVWHMEEPICEPPAIALYFISHLARKSSVKVLLSGEGGDEAFGGYQTYRNFLLLERIKSIFGSQRHYLKYTTETLGAFGWKRIRKYCKLINLPLSQYYYSRTATPATFFNQQKKSLYTKEFSNVLSKNESDTPTSHLFEKLENYSLLDRMLYVDTKTWLPDDLLVKADKMTMATSVELRVPLLDFHMLEFAASLPQNFKVHRWTTKRLLKAVLKKSVPLKILRRKKTGFPVPYDMWLRTNMKEFVSDILLDRKASIYNYISKDKARNLIKLNQHKNMYSQEIFSLLILELLIKTITSKDLKCYP